MRKNILGKVLPIIVLTSFLFNDICFSLGTQPGTTQPPTRDEMYALGQKLFAARKGPHAIDWDRSIPRKFIGQAPEIDGAQIVETNYSNPPKEWNNNRLLQETDLIKALKSFASTQADLRGANFDIRKGYFPVDQSRGEIPIARIEKAPGKYMLIVHTEFVQAWNHIRNNDVWFEHTFSDGETRIVSAAWAIFYRLAKHEMSDLQKSSRYPKSAGHIARPYNMPDLQIMRNEIIANTIGGRYNILNDGIWLWFLSSYSFTDNVRYDNDKLTERITWLFDSDDPDVRKMTREEFPNLALPRQRIYSMHRSLAMRIALFTNYHFFSRSGIAVPRFKIEPELISEYEIRERARETVGITEPPLYVTGYDEEKVERILSILTEKADNGPSITKDRLPAIVALSTFDVPMDRYIALLKRIAESADFQLEDRVIARAALLTHDIDEEENSSFLLRISRGKGVRDTDLPARIRVCGEFLVIGIDSQKNHDFLDSIVSDPKVPVNMRMLACVFLSEANYLMTKYRPFIMQVLSGDFADGQTKLFARITLLNAGIEKEESLDILYKIIEAQNQPPEFRYAASEALLRYYAILAWRKNAESPVSEVARKGVYLQDLAQHKLVNALLRIFIELKASDKNGFWHVQRIDHAKIIWIGGKHNRNSSFKDIFDKLVELEARSKGRSLPNSFDEMSVASKIVKMAGLQNRIKTGRIFLRQFKHGLEEQIEHFSVYKYRGTIYAMRKYTNMAVQLKNHADLERSMHLAAIRHTFHNHYHKNSQYAQYEKWRRNPNSKRQVRTGSRAVEGWMSYNEFAQAAHDFAELAYPVSGTINKDKRDMEGPEVPVAGVRSREVEETVEFAEKPESSDMTKEKIETYEVPAKIKTFLDSDLGLRLFTARRELSTERLAVLAKSEGFSEASLEEFFIVVHDLYYSIRKRAEKFRKFYDIEKTASDTDLRELIEADEALVLNIDSYEKLLARQSSLMAESGREEPLYGKPESSDMAKKKKRPVSASQPQDRAAGSRRSGADIQTKWELPKIISRYVVRIGLDKGPGSESLSSDDLENIYKTVGLLEKSQIEIFMPQQLKLTEDMQRAIKDIGKQDSKTPVSCRQYSDLKGLAKMLRSPSDAKRIIITSLDTEKSQDGMVRFIQEYPELFRSTRLLDVVTPENYRNMDNFEKTVHQAKIVTIAILARLFEKDKTPMVEALLRYMVKGCLDLDDRGMDAFMNELGRPGDGAGLTREELVQRVLFLLCYPIKLVEKIGREIQLMKNFWIAA